MLILMVSSVFAAPAPPSRQPQVLSGVYVLIWGGSAYQATFRSDGSCLITGAGDGRTAFHGSWKWNRSTRRLTICERQATTSRSPSGCYLWSVILNDRLEGRLIGSLAINCSLLRKVP